MTSPSRNKALTTSRLWWGRLPPSGAPENGKRSTVEEEDLLLLRQRQPISGERLPLFFFRRREERSDAYACSGRSRYRLTIGSLRSFPKARSLIFTPGGA